MPYPVVHWEFWSQDPDKCSDFYAKAFDWKINHIEEIGYRLVETGGGDGISGGIMKPEQGSWPGNMAFYIDVDDLDEVKQRIVGAGGKIIVDHQDVPNVGSFCMFADPDGRILGCWKQLAKDG